MLTWIIVSAAIAALGGGAIGIYRASNATSRRDRQLAEPPKERTIRELLPNDLVTFENKDFLVEGLIIYDEDGHTWKAARMVDEGKERWIMTGMERTPGLTSPVRVLDRDTTLQITGYPPEVLEVGGEQFRLSTRGNAGVTAQGEVGIPGLGKSLMRIRYWRYTAPGDKMVIVEQWGSDYRAVTGKAVPEHMFTLLQAT